MVPGIMGSVLERAGTVVWPGRVVEMLGGYDQMDQLLDPELEATDLIRRYFISTQYQRLIDDLERWGFHETSDPPKLYPCPYDWRQPIEHTATRLAATVDRAVADRSGSAEVTIIGHSMGGLLARHYLESGSFDSRPGIRAVRLLVTLGTPHRGARRCR
jgi:pimeloyl-ACP methyl ester carboxylesterase